MQDTLFPLAETPESPAKQREGAPRYRYPSRDQVELRSCDLNSRLPEDHPARTVWAYAEKLDVTALKESARAREGWVGRTPNHPSVHVALWLYATLEGVGSARELERLCRYHHAYEWICGGLSVNYHTLSDFRVEHDEFLSQLLTESVAVLMNQGLVKLKRVAQDGVRVRAAAGAASFRGEATLKEHLEDAREQVEALRQELESDASASSRRSAAARERAAKERAAGVEKALEELKEVRAKKTKDEQRDDARASETDPEARVMKMADGGYRPAFNTQIASDSESQVIVGVDVTNERQDFGRMTPMVEQIRERHGVVPSEYLVDAGFASIAEIEKMASPEIDSTVYAPVRKPHNSERDPHLPMRNDSQAVAKWRHRMGTEEAKAIYKHRAPAECINALLRQRGLTQFVVRGMRKAKAVLLWFALAHNLMRTFKLAPELLRVG